MVVSVPSSARWVPPLTGASSQACLIGSGCQLTRSGWRHGRHAHDDGSWGKRIDESVLTEDGLFCLVGGQDDDDGYLRANTRLSRRPTRHATLATQSIERFRANVVAADGESLAHQAAGHAQAHRTQTNERHRFRHGSAQCILAPRAACQVRTPLVRALSKLT
jgi:hypothetical protein